MADDNKTQAPKDNAKAGNAAKTDPPKASKSPDYAGNFTKSQLAQIDAQVAYDTAVAQSKMQAAVDAAASAYRDAQKQAGQVNADAQTAVDAANAQLTAAQAATQSLTQKFS